MAVRGQQICIALQADADLSQNQYQVVRVTVANRCNIASLNSVYRAVGVLQDNPNAAGKACRVAVLGETKAMAGAAIANVGIPLSHNGSGRVIAATSGLAIIGFNLEAAGADGDVIRMLLAQGPLAQV